MIDVTWLFKKQKDESENYLLSFCNLKVVQGNTLT